MCFLDVLYQTGRKLADLIGGRRRSKNENTMMMMMTKRTMDRKEEEEEKPPFIITHSDVVPKPTLSLPQHQ